MTALDKRSRSVAGLMLLIVSLSLTGCGLIETVLGIKKANLPAVQGLQHLR